MFIYIPNRTSGECTHIRPSRARSGFTLVELLVVIAIIGILIGLLLPAVNSARESGRRAACVNNMHQIAVAVASYESGLRQFPQNWGVVSATGSLPTNVSAAGAVNVVGVSWLTAILPNLDNNPLYNQTSLSQPGLLPSVGATFYSVGYQNITGSGVNNPAVLTTVISTFICPSDISTSAPQALITSAPPPPAKTNYKACAGNNWVGGSTYLVWPYPTSPVTVPYTTWPLSNSVGRNAGNPDGIDHGNGIICRGGGTNSYNNPPGNTQQGNPTITTTADLRDGASNTILLGEAVPAWCEWSAWFWFSSSTATCGIPLNYRFSGTPPATPESLASTWLVSDGFASRHPGGANFAGCDGSVHYVTDQIDFAVYQALAAIDDGQTMVPDVNNPNNPPVPVQWPQ